MSAAEVLQLIRTFCIEAPSEQALEPADGFDNAFPTLRSSTGQQLGPGPFGNVETSWLECLCIVARKPREFLGPLLPERIVKDVFTQQPTAADNVNYGTVHPAHLLALREVGGVGRQSFMREALESTLSYNAEEADLNWQTVINAASLRAVLPQPAESWLAFFCRVLERFGPVVARVQVGPSNLAALSASHWVPIATKGINDGGPVVKPPRRQYQFVVVLGVDQSHYHYCDPRLSRPLQLDHMSFEKALRFSHSPYSFVCHREGSRYARSI